MNILDDAIKAAGGVSALARHLGVEPNSVSNWKARGIPDGWACALGVMQRNGDGVFIGHIPNVTSDAQIVDAETHVSS